MHTRTRSEYKSFADSVYPKPNFCQRYCQYVSLLLFDANTDIVEMSYAYKDEIWVQIICDSVYPKPYYSPPRMSKCVIITVWCQNRHSGDVICIQGRDLSTNHLLILFIQNPISSPITVRLVCQNVLWLLFDANTNSGDVICIQGRDLSTNHLWFCLSKTPVSFTVRYHYKYLLGCITQKNW
jgi:hypothetical protein